MAIPDSHPYDYLKNEAQSLLARLHQVKPFAMTMPMVKGASVSGSALKAITELLEDGKREMYKSLTAFIQKADGGDGRRPAATELQSEFIILRLRYNSILDQLDIFADVLSQRAEHDVGIWLSGLDVLAEDGLTCCNGYCDIPPLMVFLERGHGAAIRRARTRLPGGAENPVGVIQIPRERMVGSGIASSLIHEVGHQAAESMELTKSVRASLRQKVDAATEHGDAWRHYERWISEILADCWAMGHLGISATLGLMGVVTLPKYFQFRLDLDDPHPAPYYRVKISCAFGKAMFPHAQWNKLWQLWELFYPVAGLPADKTELLGELDAELDHFIELVINHKPEALKGKCVADLFPLADRSPEKLLGLYHRWIGDHELVQGVAPTLVFAVLGQAKFNMLINADDENKHLTQILRTWAYNRN